MRKPMLLWVCAAMLSVVPTVRAQPHNFVPRGGYVPDAKTATSIALAVLSPIYGAANIEKEKPFKAKLMRNVWRVQGSLRKGWKGGGALIEIAKSDGRILRVLHGK